MQDQGLNPRSVTSWFQWPHSHQSKETLKEHVDIKKKKPRFVEVFKVSFIPSFGACSTVYFTVLLLHFRKAQENIYSSGKFCTYAYNSANKQKES